MYPVTSEPITLKTNLEDAPVVAALKDGRVTSTILNFNFCGPKAAMQGFKPMLREQAFDCGELALVTYLQAMMYNKPYVMLPYAINGKPQHDSIGYNTNFGPLTPKDLEGKTVGVRTYAQTTGLWLRGVLSKEYGVDLNKVTWLTIGKSHLAEYEDPANCKQLPEGSNLTEMILKGEFAAGILGKDMPKDECIATLIPNAKEVGEEACKRQGWMPINHVFCVHKELSKQRPDVVREIYRMLIESRRQAPEAVVAKLPPYGLAAMRKTLEMGIEIALEQKLIDRKFSVEELFDDVTGSL